MKPIHLFFALLCFAASANAQTIRYVDNNSGRTANTASFRYTTLQAAHDAAALNDIIYVVGSPTNYPSATITKTLTIIGPGYQLTNNPNRQADPHSARVNGLTFSTGSDGSVVQGLDVSGSIFIDANNITVRRCQHNSISISSNRSGIVIRQNFSFGSGISLGANCSNIAITNNFFGGGSVGLGLANTNVEISNNVMNNLSMSSATGGMSISIFNNIIRNSASLNDGAAFSNNIIQAGTITGTGSYSGTNNIAQTSIVFPPGVTGTNTNVTNAVVFITSTPSSSIDNNWRLATSGSPASGAGIGGVDIGMFGGPNPANHYVLSGIPPVPAVYFFNAPASGTTSLPNVEVRIRSNN